jgi:hypothetical protein
MPSQLNALSTIRCFRSSSSGYKAKKISTIVDSWELDRGLTLYRGEKFSKDYGTNLCNLVLDNFIHNDKFVSLMSTSSNVNVALDFGHARDRFSEEIFHSIIYKINVKKGTKCGFGVDEENEFIFDKDTKYKIKSVKQYTLENGVNKTFIELDILS